MLRHTVHNLEQCLLVKSVKSITGVVAEQNLRCFNCRLIVGCRVYHCGNLFGKTFLQGTSAGVCCLLVYEGFDFFLSQFGEYLYVFFRVSVRNIEPELVEFVRACVSWVKPHISAFGLSEFSAVGLCYQRTCEGICLAGEGAAYKFGAGCYVAPLV